MHYLIVYAHPEPRSFNGMLKDRAWQALEEAGHTVTVSDLYAMRFKAVADGRDFPERDIGVRLTYHAESANAYSTGVQSPDVVAEQEKLLAADAVILQFPFWWFGMPAILKGWVDRVFATGLAIGVPKPGTKQWLRYGEGRFAGKRAMLAVTTGGREPQYEARGIHGPIEDLLFPINHGILYYTGMTVVPPYAAFRVTRATEAEAQQHAGRYIERLLGIFDVKPIAYRQENGGDYDEQQVLRTEIGEGRSSFGLHAE